MADKILDDDLPTVPKVFTPVQFAQTPEEEAQAQFYADLCKLGVPRDWERITDDELMALATEPEFLAECTRARAGVDRTPWNVSGTRPTAGILIQGAGA